MVPAELDSGRKGSAFVQGLGFLESLASKLKKEVDPYDLIPLGRSGGDPSGEFRPLDVSRLKFPTDLLDFDGGEWLSPLSYMAFKEPLTIACTSPDPKRWKWPKNLRSEQKELMTLFKQWAVARRFLLVRSVFEKWRTARVFQVYKTSDKDRQIIDRRGQNGAEGSVDWGMSKTLSAGGNLSKLFQNGRNDFIFLLGL